MAPTRATQVQQRFHQSNFFTKNEAYKDFLIFLLGSLAFYQNYSQKPYLEGFLFQVQKLCRLERILGVLGHFHTNARSDTLTAGTVAVWKHRGTPLLHMFLPLRNGGAAERQWLWPTSWLGLHLTHRVLSHSPLLQDFLGSLPSCTKYVLALSPSIIKEQKKPIPHLHT